MSNKPNSTRRGKSDKEILSHEAMNTIPDTFRNHQDDYGLAADTLPDQPFSSEFPVLDDLIQPWELEIDLGTDLLESTKTTNCKGEETWNLPARRASSSKAASLPSTDDDAWIVEDTDAATLSTLSSQNTKGQRSTTDHTFVATIKASNATRGVLPTLGSSTKQTILRSSPSMSRRMGEALVHLSDKDDKKRTPLLQSLHVVPISQGHYRVDQMRFLAIGDLRLIEAGQAVLVQPDTSSDKNKNALWLLTARESGKTTASQSPTTEGVAAVPQAKTVAEKNPPLQMNGEVGFFGALWRRILRFIIVLCLDRVNAMQLNRSLQLQLHFLTGYEALLLSQLIAALDSRQRGGEVVTALKAVFQNRNVSRILVQTVRVRFDFLYHWGTAVTWNRLFDAIGQFPVVGALTRFPATESFPSTRNHALASIFRVVLGPGNWITRVITQGRQGLVTDEPETAAQNLAAEVNGFELANRNQYGTTIGRIKTNDFRTAHRLPVDESLVRTFITSPIATMTNNGVVHVLRHLAKHWHNMLGQEWGNFAHQRMEQLDPIESLRFHMPHVLLTLSSLRGRNEWDARVLGPMIRKLQVLGAAPDTSHARALIRELRETVVFGVSSGISSVLDPLDSWLEAMDAACLRLDFEAKQVFELLSMVETGIRLGHDIMTQADWRIPSEVSLKKSILAYILGEKSLVVKAERIKSALHQTTPRDKRTLIELVKSGYGGTAPAILLLGRVKTLLQRELRRQTLNEIIRELSTGDSVDTSDIVRDTWYWVKEKLGSSLYMYNGESPSSGKTFEHVFVNVHYGAHRLFDLRTVRLFRYHPIAELISRAQKAFMSIELDYGRRFTYNAFMEIEELRMTLRNLLVVSQMSCEALDNARLSLLGEDQRSSRGQFDLKDLRPGKTYFLLDKSAQTFRAFECDRRLDKIDPLWDELSRATILEYPPQSVLVVGGGPGGLITAMMCAESCLRSGGVMKLFEARDSFSKGGAQFERSQVVRLDARWIAVLRYHLGTVFEDYFIPASGETNAQLGNTLPSQGFVETTIKDLEFALHVEVSRMWSRGVLTVYTDSRAQFDSDLNSLTKFGANLKVGDIIYRQVDEKRAECALQHSWKVIELVHTRCLSIDDLKVGEEYGVWLGSEGGIAPFQLVGVDLSTKMYKFRSVTDGVGDLSFESRDLPTVYPLGTSITAHADVRFIIVECVKADSSGRNMRDRLRFDEIEKVNFILDVGNTHVVEAIGKPRDSKVHFRITTTEPYGVCCLQGLKVSMCMHNFGEKRWGNGLLDDIRSQNDQNTRIIGDFTKMVRVVPIVRRMHEKISSDYDWISHFNKIIETSTCLQRDGLDPIVPKIKSACKWLLKSAPMWHRQTLQTRFFETGDNFYLGMELNREFDAWKISLVDDIINPIAGEELSHVRDLRNALLNGIDRLWYDGCLETIREGDVYNPGARHRVPKLYLIDSGKAVSLGSLPCGESFSTVARPDLSSEVLFKRPFEAIARNVEGYINRLGASTKVVRRGNLTRGPDGKLESKVALSTFEVGHDLNYRAMRVSNADRGYVFAFVGDEQSTPHFMRYSGLTGACINAMSFNKFIESATDGCSFVGRLRAFTDETNWSNGEVVQRGTGTNGLDGFLRPGCSYNDCVDFLHSKLVECREIGKRLDECLSVDWKVKFGAAMIPRGMEMSRDFARALTKEWHTAVLRKFETDVGKDFRIAGVWRQWALSIGKRRSPEEYWAEIEHRLKAKDSDPVMAILRDHMIYARYLRVVCRQLIESSIKGHLYNERISSELVNQPKAVDAVVDDFAVEAQSLANSLVQSAAFASGALAFRLLGGSTANLVSAVLTVVNIGVSFGTMANTSRYKIRNEEARINFKDKILPQTVRTLYFLMAPVSRDLIPAKDNPFLLSLHSRVMHFKKMAHYYGYIGTCDFDKAFQLLLQDAADPMTIRAFQRVLVSRFIAGEFHVNTYVQDALVEIYRECQEILILLSRKRPSNDDGNIEILFHRFLQFALTLENTLQRGAVRWGFVKRRHLLHWDLFAGFRYFYSLLFCSSLASSCRLQPIQSETLDMYHRIKLLSSHCKNDMLQREVIDLRYLFWATRESDVASLIFLSSFMVFVASIVFTLARVFSIAILESFSFWANAVSSLGAILAMCHFFRKVMLLSALLRALRRKSFKVEQRDSDKMRTILLVTVVQILLTALRLIASCAAAVSLPWSAAEKGYGDRIASESMVPFWIALGAVISAVVSTVLFFLVEYVVRYRLSVSLGPFIAELFRKEIEGIYTSVAMPSNHSISPPIQTREIWEYVAREFFHLYRFDTVFDADRFGQILQYVQGGMDQSANKRPIVEGK